MDKPKTLEDAQAMALEALGEIDVKGLVQRLEQDSTDGAMSPGQRKTAHLLLAYYAPKAQPIAPSEADGLHLSSAQILDLLREIRSLRGSTGQNSDPGLTIDQNSDPNQSLASGQAKQGPSLPESVSSAGGTLKGEVLSDTARESSGSNTDTPSPDDSESGTGESRRRRVPDSVKHGLL